MIRDLHLQYGNHWSKIAKKLPGRTGTFRLLSLTHSLIYTHTQTNKHTTGNAVKNRFHSTIAMKYPALLKAAAENVKKKKETRKVREAESREEGRKKRGRKRGRKKKKTKKKKKKSKIVYNPDCNIVTPVM